MSAGEAETQISFGSKSQRGGDGSVNIQGDRVNVSTGLSYTDVRDVAMDVFRQNFVELREEAAKLAVERAEALVDTFLQGAKEQEIPLNEVGRDPDFQIAMFAAQREYARTGDGDLEKVLIELLKERAKAAKRNLVQIVFNECIAVAPKLTSSQLDALALIFLLARTKNHSVADDATLATYIASHLLPFLDGASREPSHFEHLVYAGCGTISVGTFDITRTLGENYPMLRYKGFKKEEIDAMFVGIHASKPLFFPCDSEPGSFRLIGGDHDSVIAYAIAAGVPADKAQAAWDAQASRTAGNEAAMEAFKRCHPRGADIESWYRTTPAQHFALTSVGIGLAYAHIRERLKVSLDLGIWIKP